MLAATVDVPEGFMLDAHNLYMELLAETGVLGFIAFFILAFSVMRRGVNTYKNSRTLMDAVVGFAVATGVMSVIGTRRRGLSLPQFAAICRPVLSATGLVAGQ